MPQETPGSRVQQALAQAIGASPDAGEGPIDEPEELPVAATVVIARDAPRGPEVLLIERPDRGSFAGAWVFPGGKLEASDRAAGASGHVTDELAARRAAVRETLEETGLVLDADALVPLSHWSPPPGLPLRILTWFFVTRAPDDVTLELAADEAVSATWARPADVLERHGRGELTLYPPTWVTLYELAGQSDVDDLLAVARLGGVHSYETLARRAPSGPYMLWQEDAEYDADSAAEASETRARPRHRLSIGDLPWIYERSF
ncbi:NUDIX hydrolase [Microbacterium immunditiarum]|uniref:8-oxo-dGTP pyrophosphatase MutT (NUDIX family) n=1 Tax=Microbacterium immunditiarum TaxID=337480 RepID=A0A7Y9KMN1_9MICO|nr:NUDIX hydrolase [Microbacterium immunditiarum]NYE20949.1 8-oxo-dGTP pyrophosphatase MutT (NUDIX family) [Microbacterium immunditiarum]